MTYSLKCLFLKCDIIILKVITGLVTLAEDIVIVIFGLFLYVIPPELTNAYMYTK